MPSRNGCKEEGDDDGANPPRGGNPEVTADDGPVPPADTADGGALPQGNPEVLADYGPAPPVDTIDDCSARKRSTPQRNVEILFDDGPAPPVPVSDAATTEKSIAKQGTDAASEVSHVDTSIETQQHNARGLPPGERLPGDEVLANEPATRMNCVADGADEHYEINVNTEVDGVSPVAADNTESVGIHIPEAWAVDEHNEEPVPVVDASNVEMILPWWEQKQNMLYTWALLFMLSAISLAAYKIHPEYDYHEGKGWQHWGSMFVACSSGTMWFSVIASLAHVTPNNPVSRRVIGSVLEGVVSVLIGIWWGVVQVLSTQERSEGTEGQQNYNSTLFFSSWGCITCSVVLSTMYMDENRETILRFFRIPFKSHGMGMGYTVRWALLVIASIVVVFESSWFKANKCDGAADGVEGETCVRNIYGLVTGETKLQVVCRVLQAYHL